MSANVTLIDRSACPICGEARSTRVGTKKTLDPNSAIVVDLLCCGACGHWWHSPAPEAATLPSLYAASSPLVVTDGAQEQYVNRTHLDWFSEFVAKRSNGRRRYLEIGAGGGHLMNAFASRGYDCWAVEPGQWSPNERVVRALSDLPAGAQFDLIVLQDVLEHTADPVEVLAAARARAAEGAQVFCSFPCSESPIAQRERAGWTMVLPFGHLHYFSRRSAALLLSRSGWQLREARMTRAVSLRRLLRLFRLKAFAWEILKGGPDQLYVAGVAA